MDYVIESNDEQHLLLYLKPKLSSDQNLIRKDFHLKYLNDHYQSLTKKNLFEEYLMVRAKDAKFGLQSSDREYEELGDKFFQLMFALLEELAIIEDIVGTIPIDKLIYWAEHRNLAKELLGVFEAFESDEVMEELEKRFFIDDLLGHIVAYWTPKDKNYEMYKIKFIDLSPFFKLMFMILEANEESFVVQFEDILIELEETYEDRYGNAEHYTTNFMFIMLLCAMLNDRFRVIDHVLKYNNFETVNLFFPPNMRTTDTTKYVALKLMEIGHDIDDLIPKDWVTSDVFEKFLSSRIKTEGDGLISLDCTFMLHVHTKKFKIRNVNDVDEKLIMWEDTTTLEFILNSKALRHFVTHPVISEYINLKSLKYRSIDLVHAAILVFLFIIPGSILMFTKYFNDGTISAVAYILSSLTVLLGIFLLIPRKLFIFWFIHKKRWKSYSREKTNWIEIFLVVTSVCLIALFLVLNTRILIALNLAFITSAVALCFETLASNSIPFYVILAKKGFMALVQFLLTFALLLFAFLAGVQVISGITLNDAFSFTVKLNKTSDQVETDPSQRLLLFLCLILLSVITFNFIFGSTIGDISQLKKDSHRLGLERKSRKFIASKSLSFEVYLARFVQATGCKVFVFQFSFFFFNRESGHKFFETRFGEVVFLCLKIMFNQYPFLHKIDKIYINESRDITFDIDERQRKVVNRKISQETFRTINRILKANEHAKGVELVK